MTRVITALLLALFAVSLPGCKLLGWDDRKTDQALEDLKECALKAYKDAADRVVPLVADILQTGGDDWLMKLEELGSKVGLPAVVCAVNAVMQAWASEAPDGGAVGSSAAELRARSYLKAKGF
jgi:hypothetical protein